MVNYWRRAIRRAWDDTLAIFQQNLKSLILASVVTAVGFGLFAWLEGGSEAWQQQIKPYLITAIGGCAVFVIILIYHVLAAPSKMEKDAVAIHTENMNQVEANSIPQDVIEQLGAFMAKGTQLLSRYAQRKLNTEEKMGLAVETEQWTNDVQSYLEGALDRSFLTRFQFSKSTTPLPDGLSAEMRETWRMINAKVEKLEAFIKELSHKP